jgi:hypothetical protein
MSRAGEINERRNIRVDCHQNAAFFGRLAQQGRIARIEEISRAFGIS